jgi:phage tail sheath protein FI
MLPLSDSPADYQLAPLLATQQVILTFCQARTDVLGVLTLPSHFRTADCLDWQTQFRGRYFLPSRPTLSENLRTLADLSYVAVYHPWLLMADPGEPDGLSTNSPEGAACGLIAARELARGVWVAAGNLPVANVLGLSPSLPPSDLPDLFDRRFNLIRQQTGDFRLVSAHTLGDGRELLQISVRRLMILLRKLAVARGMDYVFRNNDRFLAEVVRAGLLAMLQEMFKRGAFAGATPQESYRVFTGEDVNPRQSIDAGQFVAVIQVAPSQPLEFITVVLVRQPDGSLKVTEG